MERAVRHGSTFGGNDLAAAAGLATLRVLDREHLIERARRMGELLMELTGRWWSASRSSARCAAWG